MRRFLSAVGVTLCAACGAICAGVHAATFVTILSFWWIVPPFALLFAAAFCAQAFRSEQRFKKPARNLRVFGFVLLGYAVLTFIYDYRVTGGASSVSIIDGQYVAMYKTQVIGTITEREYKMFPNLWVRVLSAWMGMMAVFALLQFPSLGTANKGDS